MDLMVYDNALSSVVTAAMFKGHIKQRNPRNLSLKKNV